LAKAGHLIQQRGDLVPLVEDGRAPTGGLALRLRLPLEQVGDQHPEPAQQFPAFAAPHVPDLLGEVRDIGFGELPRGQEIGVADGPPIEVLLVEFRGLHSDNLPLLLARPVGLGCKVDRVAFTNSSHGPVNGFNWLAWL
jgi:hypothetical protein